MPNSAVIIAMGAACAGRRRREEEEYSRKRREKEKKERYPLKYRYHEDYISTETGILERKHADYLKCKQEEAFKCSLLFGIVTLGIIGFCILLYRIKE